MKKLVILVVLGGVLFLGLRSLGFFGKGGHETSLTSLQIIASEDASAKTNLLVLVNKDNKLPDDYKVNLTTIGDVKVASVLVEDLKDMRDAAEEDNVQLSIASAYRSTAEQEQILNDTISDYVKQGNPQHIAEVKAKNTAALPGYSEHETGLAIDFSFDGNAEKQAEMWDWLSKNSYKYGFILRYPDGERNITGYKNEQWHYRYVGREHARAIFERGIALEEYLGKTTEQNFDEQDFQDHPPGLRSPRL
jgi:D-alanyl-D-alanine carboxypeptidase